LEKAGLILAIILSIVGVYFIDKNILISFELNHSKWFGKYVFFAAFNILIFWSLWVFYKKFEGIFKIIVPIMFGVIILFIGVKLA
jgi:hypothetical protein